MRTVGSYTEKSTPYTYRRIAPGLHFFIFCPVIGRESWRSFHVAWPQRRGPVAIAAAGWSV